MANFSILTLNTFGAPGLSTRRRLLTLARELNASNYDAACLQEVQVNAYRRMLISTSTRFSNHNYAPFVHAPKGGLLTLTRPEITHRRFILYRDRGLWHTPAVADWILHKGILLTQMEVTHQPITVLNTHLTANYAGNWKRTNLYTRQEEGQLRQLAEVIHDQPPEELVIVTGDFNVPRDSDLFREFMATSGLIDPLCESTEPTYRPMRGLPNRYAVAIDFALYRAPALPKLSAQGKIVYRDKIDLIGGQKGHLSDHYGVELCLSWG